MLKTHWMLRAVAKHPTENWMSTRYNSLGAGQEQYQFSLWYFKLITHVSLQCYLGLEKTILHVFMSKVRNILKNKGLFSA